MTVPFLDLFKKITERFTRARASEEPRVPAVAPRAVKKPASERLSKTVLPNATRSFSAPDLFRSAAGVTDARSATSPLELGASKITAATKRSQSGHSPSGLARALEPKLERAISLQIADFIDRVPAGYVKPAEILDSAAQVSLKASEIEKGMSEKNPTIPLPSLYQQVPEIFLRGVRPDDEMRVSLPYDKVLEQFQSAQVRADQERDPAVPQLDTPILKATIQDSERFGTKMEPLQASPVPPVPVKLATAESVAAAQPDAIVHGSVKSTPSGHPVVSLYSPELKPKSEPTAPPSPSRPGPKIAFELLPNGTGASVSERVPASSGPPVPTPLAFKPEPARIPFQAFAEKPKAPPPLKLTEPTAPKAPVTQAPAKDETAVTLSVKPVLQNVPLSN